MLQNTNSKKGFTIIEVLIVLAVAGLIMLIVFMAVPALQRNSRNTQRNSDASLVGAGVNECLNNRNGQTSACNTWSGELNQYIDTSKLRQLTTVNAANSVPSNNTSINIAFGRKCNPAGSNATTSGANSRSVALLFNTENTSGGNVSRCIEV